MKDNKKFNINNSLVAVFKASCVYFAEDLRWSGVYLMTHDYVKPTEATELQVSKIKRVEALISKKVPNGQLIKKPELHLM